MGVNTFRAISSRPFLIGRALDGPLLPTVLPAERVRKRRLASQCTDTHTAEHPRPEGRGRLCCGALRLRFPSTRNELALPVHGFTYSLAVLKITKA